MGKRQRQHYFDVTVHHPKVKDTISGKNEDMVIKALNSTGLRVGKDYFRQYPIGEKFVLDFAFIKEQIAVEVDGENHLSKKQIILDRKRDNFLRMNNWVVIRIADKNFFGYKITFYKNLILEVVKERRE